MVRQALSSILPFLATVWRERGAAWEKFGVRRLNQPLHNKRADGMLRASCGTRLLYKLIEMGCVCVCVRVRACVRCVRMCLYVCIRVCVCVRA